MECPVEAFVVEALVLGAMSEISVAMQLSSTNGLVRTLSYLRVVPVVWHGSSVYFV